MVVKFNTTKVNGDVVVVELNMVNYGDLIRHDIAVLESLDIEELKANALMEFGANENDVLDALNGDGSVRGRKGLLTSLKQSVEGANPDFHASAKTMPIDHDVLGKVNYDASIDSIYVSGLVVSETMAVEGAVKTPKKEVKSGIVVQLKSWIEYTYGLKACKFRTYKCSSATEFSKVGA